MNRKKMLDALFQIFEGTYSKNEIEQDFETLKKHYYEVSISDVFIMTIGSLLAQIHIDLISNIGLLEHERSLVLSGLLAKQNESFAERLENGDLQSLYTSFDGKIENATLDTIILLGKAYSDHITNAIKDFIKDYKALPEKDDGEKEPGEKALLLVDCILKYNHQTVDM